MGINRRDLIAGAGLASASAALGSAGERTRNDAEEQPQFIDHWIIQHGGDCCGCAVSKREGSRYSIVCNECGEPLDVLVSEVAFNRMAEALQRAQHALTFAHGHIAHDGKPE